MECINSTKQQQISIVIELLENSGLTNTKWATRTQILEGGVWANNNKKRILRTFPKRSVRQLHPSQTHPGSTIQSSLALLNQMLHHIGASRIRNRRVGRIQHGASSSEDLYCFGGLL